MRKLNDSQQELLEKMREFYYGGHSIPHLAMVQRFPGREEDIVGWDLFQSEFEHYYLNLDSEKKDENTYSKPCKTDSPPKEEGCK